MNMSLSQAQSVSKCWVREWRKLTFSLCTLELCFKSGVREEQEHKSFVWGITMSDKLDFMSERVTAISRPFIVIILAENLLFFLLHLPLSARQADFLSQIKSEKMKSESSSKLKLNWPTSSLDSMWWRFFRWCENWLKIKKSVGFYNNKASFVSVIYFSHRIELWMRRHKVSI